MVSDDDAIARIRAAERAHADREAVLVDRQAWRDQGADDQQPARDLFRSGARGAQLRDVRLDRVGDRERPACKTVNGGLWLKAGTRLLCVAHGERAERAGPGTRDGAGQVLPGSAPPGRVTERTRGGVARLEARRRKQQPD